MRGAKRSWLGRGVLLAALALPACRSGSGPQADAPPPVGTEVGNTAPPLQGRRSTGEPFRLRTDGPVVLVFYRGNHCGLCRLRLQQLGRHLPDYRALGAEVVAVTPDPPPVALATERRLGLQFPVVSTDSAQLARWGILGAAAPVPRPATFVLDRRGVVVYRHVGRNAADRSSDAGLIAVLQRASAAR